MAKTTIIIPVKDEEDGLEHLLGQYSSSELYDDEEIQFIFVIDGRTSDNSREIAGRFSQKIIDQKESHGKGAAIQQAVTEWKKNPTELVIFLDADGSYPFNSVISVLSTLNEGADIVSGSRFLNNRGRPVGMSRLHYIGNKALSFFSRLRNRRKISDLCTGLWGFKSEALIDIKIQSSGFDLEAELFGRSRRLKLNHVETPVKWNQRKGGHSKLRSITDGFIIFLRIVRT